jgi:hypothetical protein
VEHYSFGSLTIENGIPLRRARRQSIAVLISGKTFAPSSLHRLRLFRAAVIVALAWMVFRENTGGGAAKSRRDARTGAQVFPSADRLSPRDLERGGHYVFTAHQLEPLGYVLTTAPEGNDLIGYSGPSNVLVALDTHGAIVGQNFSRRVTRPITSRLYVRRRNSRAPSTDGNQRTKNRRTWPRSAGQTLTSAAIAEGIVRRLAGHAPSLRFPEPVTFEEVRNLFPTPRA